MFWGPKKAELKTFKIWSILNDFYCQFISILNFCYNSLSFFIPSLYLFPYRQTFKIVNFPCFLFFYVYVLFLSYSDSHPLPFSSVLSLQTFKIVNFWLFSFGFFLIPSLLFPFSPPFPLPFPILLKQLIFHVFFFYYFYF